jgi:hypothetical protein
MKKNLTFSCIGLLAFLLILTSFRMSKQTPANHIAGPYQIEIDNNSSGKTITSCTVGSYAPFTGLSIPPGGTAEFGELTPISGSITVSVTCSSAWAGTIEYDEWENEIACTNLGTGATHSLTATASDVYFRRVSISSETRPCINCEPETKDTSRVTY